MTEPFSSFMRRALYDPGRGYYTARIRTVGARGDFSTSATLSSLLGKAVASWLRREAGETAVRTIIEIGGGDGSLMAAVTAALGWWGRLGLQFRMVEASPLLAARQRARLGGRIKAWHATLPEALAASGGRALLFHNELLDAFPVDLVQGDGHAWQEVWLRHEAGACVRSCARKALIYHPTVSCKAACADGVSCTAACVPGSTSGCRHGNGAPCWPLIMATCFRRFTNAGLRGRCAPT